MGSAGSNIQGTTLSTSWEDLEERFYHDGLCPPCLCWIPCIGWMPPILLQQPPPPPGLSSQLPLLLCRRALVQSTNWKVGEGARVYKCPHLLHLPCGIAGPGNLC